MLPMLMLEKESTPVVEVSNVELIRVTNANKRELHIKATGFSQPTGWDKPRLELRNPYWKPLDGIYEFDFLGSAPAGDASKQLEKLFVSLEWDEYPKGIKGIRIFAGSNSILKML